MLTHLSKTNALGRRPSVISKSILFVDSQHPLSPYSMLQYASWTLWPGYNIEKGRGGRNVKIRHGKTHAFTETGLFRGVSQLLLSMIVGGNRTRPSAYLLFAGDRRQINTHHPKIRMPRSKDFFFTSCGSLIPFTRANAQWVIHGLNKHFTLHFRVNSLFHNWCS